MKKLHLQATGVAVYPAYFFSQARLKITSISVHGVSDRRSQRPDFGKSAREILRRRFSRQNNRGAAKTLRVIGIENDATIRATSRSFEAKIGAAKSRKKAAGIAK